MMPPEELPPTEVLPSPATVRPPLAPVLLSTMPLAGSAPPSLLPAEMLLKFKPLAPMVVLATLRAVALVELMVLLLPVTLTAVAPPVALKPVPLLVVRFRPPVKLIVAPALVVRSMALAVVVLAVMAPEKALVPPVLDPI